MDTYSFILYIETDYIYTAIIENVDTRFDTANFELNRWYLKGKKIVIRLMKDD